jgi:hypothetical protein
MPVCACDYVPQMWCPELRVARLHSSVTTEREHLKRTVLTNLNAYDAVVTTYEVSTACAWRALKLEARAPHLLQ